MIRRVFLPLLTGEASTGVKLIPINEKPQNCGTVLQKQCMVKCKLGAFSKVCDRVYNWGWQPFTVLPSYCWTKPTLILEDLSLLILVQPQFTYRSNIITNEFSQTLTSLIEHLLYVPYPVQSTFTFYYILLFDILLNGLFSRLHRMIWAVWLSLIMFFTLSVCLSVCRTCVSVRLTV